MPGDTAHPLEPGPREMRRLADAAVQYAAAFVERRAAAPSVDLDGAFELASELRGGFPEHGQPFEELLDVIGAAVDKAVDTAGPGYLAYIPGGGLVSAAIADFVALTVNRYVGIAATAPALAQMEADVVRFCCDLFSLPPQALGVLTSGGSMANFSAIVTARTTRLREDVGRAIIYASEQVHHSVAKAARLAGFPVDAVRTVRCTPELRMDVGALREAIAADRARHLQPLAVVASAGTTNTGTIDPLDDLGALAVDEGLWFHVDAAYGGFFQLTERGRARLRGIERADSITLDPHKGMFLPYGTGCLLVRDHEPLRYTHEMDADYLQDLGPTDGPPDFARYSPELSREFRGLRVWLPLRLHGVAAFRDALDEKLDLTRVVHDALSDTPGFEVPWEPDLSIVAFRYRPRSGDADAFNHQLLQRINASRRVFLSSTVIGGRYTLRVCVLSHRTHRDRIDEAIDIIRRSATELDA